MANAVAEAECARAKQVIVDAERFAAEKAAAVIAVESAAAQDTASAASCASVVVNIGSSGAVASNANGCPMTDTEELIAANRQRKEDQKIETRALQAKRLASKIVKGSFHVLLHCSNQFRILFYRYRLRKCHPLTYST